MRAGLDVLRNVRLRLSITTFSGKVYSLKLYEKMQGRQAYLYTHVAENLGHYQVCGTMSNPNDLPPSIAYAHSYYFQYSY